MNCCCNILALFVVAPQAKVVKELGDYVCEVSTRSSSRCVSMHRLKLWGGARQ